MNWEAMFPGRFIKSAEFAGRDVTLTIAGVTLEELPEDNGKTRKRGVMSFRETPKGLVLNRTNATACKFLFGAETDAWKGKRITLWPAPFTDPFTGEEITAVRVRGTPELDKPKSFQAKIGRKLVNFKLVPTGKPTNGKPAAPPPQTPIPQADDTLDGLPPDEGEGLGPTSVGQNL